MLNNNTEILQLLVGNVEWILSQNWFGDSLRILARVDGKLAGLVISHYSAKRYGWNSVEDVGPASIRVETMPREDVLGAVAFLDGTKLTPDERRVWLVFCDESARKQAERKTRRAKEDLKRKRREYEELKKEFGDE